MKFTLGKNPFLLNNHFIFILLINIFLFVFYLVFRVLMASKLMIFKNLNFFSGKLFYHIEGYPQYTLFRVFVPVFFLAVFFLLFYLLFHKKGLAELHADLKSLCEKRCLKFYLVFILLLFVIFCLIPDFSLLIRNINTSYGLFDTDSYISLITMMRGGDYNANYVPEGGLQFGKYYPLTIPTLILSFFLGATNIISSYNIIVTLLVFFIVINTIFTLSCLSLLKNDSFLTELISLIFGMILLIISFRFVMIRDYFGFYPLLWTYCNGFYGVLGGIFLFSSALFLLSYLIREKIDDHRDKTILWVVFLMGSFIIQGYFNLSLIFLPAASCVLAIVLSGKVTVAETIKNLILLSFFLVANFLGYIALDVFPSFNTGSTAKLVIMFVFFQILFVILSLINSKTNDFVLKKFFKHRSFCVLIFFFFPFVGYFLSYRGLYDTQKIHQIVSVGYPLVIDTFDVNNTRLTFYFILLAFTFFGYLLFKLLINIFSNIFSKKLFSFLLLILMVIIFGIRNYDPRKPYLLNYPEAYDNQRKIMDLNNQYVFDNTGIRLFYNPYMVDLTSYFVNQKIHRLLMWVVSETPSRGIYEHGLLGRLLIKEGLRPEAQTVMDINSFANNLFEFEVQTRDLAKIYGERYLIIDNNFPAAILEKMASFPIFKEIYHNALYRVFWLKMPN